MSAIDLSARQWAAALEAMEKERTHVSVPVARRTVARRIGVAPGSLENLSRGRSKGVRVTIYEKIRAAFIRACEQEMARLQHEMELARQAGRGPHSGEIGEIQAHFAALRTLLKEGR